MENVMEHFDLGQASIHPPVSIVAGSFTTIKFIYAAGHPIDDSGYVKIAFRLVGDFGTPQFEDPAAANYCTVSTTGDCRIEPRWDPKGHTRPWSKALFLMVRGGFLNSGEEIEVVFGETSSGSPGWQMQTFCERSFELKTFVDPIATYQFKELPSSPTLSIVPGKPVRAVCIAPSEVMVGIEFSYHLKFEDKWGNPPGLPEKRPHPGFESAGFNHVQALDEKTNISARSNPIEIVEEKRSLTRFWADFHGQTEETVGTNSIEDYFTFARDFGLLDIAAHQGNDFQISGDFWERINQVSREFYQPGVFVSFPGYEWSGNTPLGGDRNVFFTSEGAKISRSSADLLRDDIPDYENSPTVSDLFAFLRVREGPKPFVFAHVGGRYSDLDVHDPDIELAVEVHSAWGTFEWLVEEALNRGYRVGICANSDGHKCRPGASYPGAGDFGSLGGLTCVLARKLDRESVFEALKARHFYATTGNRSLVDLRLETGDGREAMMGDIIEIGEDKAHLHLRLEGSGPIERVDLYNGLEIVNTMRPYGKDDLGHRVKIVWSGAEVRGRDRSVKWDGNLQVKGNGIHEAQPINFWNAHQLLEMTSRQKLRWRSSTTGGVAGFILKLERSTAGSLIVDTVQGEFSCEIDSMSSEPMVRELGGLRKEIRGYRLPSRQNSSEFFFSLPLTDLRPGDNPIYIRMTQEDGHIAWTSPIYLVHS